MQKLINELENAVNSAVRLPVGGRLLMDEALLRHIIEELRRAAPDHEAVWQQIVAERDRVLADANAHARRITEQAQYGNLDEQAIVQAARQRAREVLTEAEQAAVKLRADADDYVLNQFNVFEQRLMRVLREVQAGQRVLHGGES